MNAPGTSHVTTCQFSMASVRHVRNSASVVIVGEVVSSLFLYNRCFLPSAHPHPLILPHHFCFRNIRYFNAAFFCAVVRSPDWRPSITFLYTSWLNSFMIASAPAAKLLESQLHTHLLGHEGQHFC